MGVSLSKGSNVSLTKTVPGLKDIEVGLGWDVSTFAGGEFDLDASCIVVKSDGKVISDSHFVFFNNLKTPDGSVEHMGDNLTGEGDGDDEMIKVSLPTVPVEGEKIVFLVSIHEADVRKQNFGGVRNAFIRVVDGATKTEIARYDLSEDASSETAMVFGEVYRDASQPGGFKFKAVGQGYASGLRGIAQDYGVNVG